MYEVIIEHPAFGADRLFTCKDTAELRTLVHGVHRAQGRAVAGHVGTVAEVDELRARADVEGVGLLNVGACRVRVKPAEHGEYACEGHESLYVGLGETVRCDGSCVRRPQFDRTAMADLSMALDDADLDQTGGCSACGLEAGWMCAACRRCNCHEHGQCQRPTTTTPPAVGRRVVEGIVVTHAGSAKGSTPIHSAHPSVVAARTALDGLMAARMTDRHDVTQPTEDEKHVRGYLIEPRGGDRVAVFWLEGGRIIRRDDERHGTSLDHLADRFRSRGWLVEAMLKSSQCVFAHRPPTD